jgi:hypothetical protein
VVPSCLKDADGACTRSDQNVVVLVLCSLIFLVYYSLNGFFQQQIAKLSLS